MTRTGKITLGKFGIKEIDFSKALNRYLIENGKLQHGHEADLIYIDFVDKSLGTMFNVYGAKVFYAIDHHIEDQDNINLILKHYKGWSSAKDFSGIDSRRRDMLVYEATVLKNLSDYVPRFCYSGKNVLIMEDIGRLTLESTLLNMPLLRGIERDNKLFENLIARVAGFHSGLEDIVTSGKFKNHTTPDYVGRFSTYMGEIFSGLNGEEEIPPDLEKRFREAFLPIASIFYRGRLNENGGQRTTQPIHEDLHPPHIFYTTPGSGELKAYFIDFRPTMGPVQFDLVDLLKHPLVYPYLKDGDEKIDKLLRLYMRERLKIINKKLGGEINPRTAADIMRSTTEDDAQAIQLSPDFDPADLTTEVSDKSFNEFKTMFQLSRVYRGIRSASKNYSSIMRKPQIYQQYIGQNKNYPLYPASYLGDVVDACEEMDSNTIKYPIDSKTMGGILTIHGLLEKEFSGALKKRNKIITKLKIKEEDLL